MKKLVLLLSLFAFTANAQYTKLFDFDGTNSGSFPFGALVSDGTYLYGMTRDGGINNVGTIFKIKTDGTGFTKLFDFSTAQGCVPYGSLIYDGTYLYGMTSSGGSFTVGVIFKIKPDGTNYTKLHEFAGNPDGASPKGSLYFDGTYLYGLTNNGGITTSGNGMAFKLLTNGTGYTKLCDFDPYPMCGNPQASFISDGTYLYSTAAAAYGYVFKLLPNPGNYTVVTSNMNSINGTGPYGSLVYDGTYMYGTFSQGGANSLGTLFKVKPDGTGFTKLIDFNATTTGGGPVGSLVIVGNYLYGLTYNGGPSNGGVLYAVKNDGTGFINAYNFSSGVNGHQLLGSLISDGTYFYGMTNLGGVNNKGVVFKFNLLTVGLNELKIKDEELKLYPNPANDMLNVELTHSRGSGQEMLNAKLEIINTLGQVLQTTQLLNQTTKINIDGLPNGIYTVFLQNNEQKLVKKVIIQH